MTKHQMVQTPLGPARAWSYRVAPRRRRRGVLMLGHGAGGGVDAADIAALAAALPSDGIDVVLVEQPWRVAGRKVAAPPKQLDVAWIAIAEALRSEGVLTAPLVLGGRSAGARVACRTAGTLGAAGVLALAFPLHPPGRPDRSRLDELVGVGVPTLVVQGERDPFGGPDEFPIGTDLVAIPAADHCFRAPARDGGPVAAVSAVVAAAGEWLSRHL
jgi:predicted alpha/beta-hydrolase family hydrolase